MSKRRSLWRSVLSVPLFAFLAISLAAGTLVYFRFGWDQVKASLSSDLSLILTVLPVVAGALLIASFIPPLLPRAALTRVMGDQSGLSGMAVASLAGTLTPGGPMTSFPLILALRSAGSGTGTLVSYITSWSTLGLQRILVWELPLMGPGFAILRVVSSLPLGIVAGLLASRFPDPLSGQDESGKAERRVR